MLGAIGSACTVGMYVLELRIPMVRNCFELSDLGRPGNAIASELGVGSGKAIASSQLVAFGQAIALTLLGALQAIEFGKAIVPTLLWQLQVVELRKAIASLHLVGFGPLAS